MANHPSQENEEKLYEIKSYVKELQTEWSENVDDLTIAKENIKDGDLFAILEYLTFCDQLYKAIYVDLKEINSLLQSLTELKEKFHRNKPRLDFIEDLFTEIQDLKNSKQKKLQSIDEEYSILAESALQHSQDIIAKFAEEIEQEKISNLKTEINQNLDKELFLQELRDSLESYRQAREDFVSEVEMHDIRKLPDDRIPEDLGEEKPEMDPILSQLDTAISSCDIALLNKEIGD